MTARTKASLTSLFIVMLFTLIQTACSGQDTITLISTITPTYTPVPTAKQKSTPTSTQAYIASPTSYLIANEMNQQAHNDKATQIAQFHPTLNPTMIATKQAWYVTAVAAQETERAESEQAWSVNATQIAQFPLACEDVNYYLGDISPDGKWLALPCGYKSNQILIVQNKEGIKWILEFKDFLSPDSPDDMMGFLPPKFWSPDGKYLYFSIVLGYDGGGDYCFPSSRGKYGLFRLNLRTGTWSTVIPSTDLFPGYEIEFSPTGRYYAITIEGVTIADLQTEMSTKLDTNGVIQAMSWSPDGKHLAYSEASCNEQSILSSSIYVWDTLTNKSQILFTTSGMKLKPELWADNSTLRIIGEEIIGFDSFYTIYEYDITQDRIMFTGTATPPP